jgi:hypothetical protein
MKRKQYSTRRSDAADRYPHLWDWVRRRGWVEIGCDGHLPSFARALDAGGLVWESKGKYASLEDALRDLDQGIAAWLRGDGESQR